MSLKKKKNQLEFENEQPEKEVSPAVKIIKGFFRFAGRMLVTALSVFIISGCIIGCVLATVFSEWSTTRTTSTLMPLSSVTPP